MSTAQTWLRTLDAELEALADLTAVHGPWEAAVLLHGALPVFRVGQFRAPVPVPVPLVPRSVAGQRALIAARSRKRRHRALALLSRRWAT